MAYNGIGVPGIVSPDENIENFARLYGNDSLGMMLMASTIGGQPGKPQFKESNNSEYFPNINRPAFADDRNPNTISRNGLQVSGGSEAMRHGGNGNHYHPRYSHHNGGVGMPRAFQGSNTVGHGGYGDHCNSRYSRQQEGFPFTRSVQGPTSTGHGGHGDQYYQQMYPQQNQYSVPSPPRYAWL